MKKRRVQSKIGKLLFHRMGIVAELLVAPIVLFAAGIVGLRGSGYFSPGACRQILGCMSGSRNRGL